MNKDRKKLVLIDGNAIVHRAYHALPKTMTTRNGEPTNATYGFMTTLIKILENLQPEYLAASFDLAGPTFRHDHYKEYKATRVKADQELYDQIPRIKEILRTMNIPIYEMQGFEADDCIGTITKLIQKSKIKNQKNGIRTYIVSGDKDIYQLVNDDVVAYSLRKGLNNLTVVDEETIMREYGLHPADFVDLKALAGDASDNIPGVPGIGAVTATKLIQEFDNIDKLYQTIAKLLNCSIVNNESMKQCNNEMTEKAAKELNIKPRILKLLVDHCEQAFMSHKLATIHRDVPIDFSLEDCKFGEYDRDKLKSLFEELGFQSLLRRFDRKENDETKMKNDEQMTKTKVKKKDNQLKLL